MIQKILAVVAHPDDEVIGVGGTLRKYAKAGHQVHVLILGDGKTSRTTPRDWNRDIELNLSRGESERAATTLGVASSMRLDLPDNRFDTIPLLEIVKSVSDVVAQTKPDVVLTHHHGDLNIDHRRTFEATITACRPIEHNVEKILLFETLSSTEMAGPVPKDAFMPNYFVDVSAELEEKLLAMSAYESELRDFPHPRSLETIRHNAMLWGSKVNIPAAEAFSLFRYVEQRA